MTTITEAAALETLAVALFESRQRASDNPTPHPWHSSGVTTQMRNAYRAYARDMLGDREAFDNPPSSLRMIEPWEAQVLCVLNGEDPRHFIDYSDLRNGKENWEYFQQEHPVEWRLKASEFTRAMALANEKRWRVNWTVSTYEFAPETEETASA